MSFYYESKKYLKHKKTTYKACTKWKESKQEDFYNEHITEIILFESAKKYPKEDLGESKSLHISKWKSQVITFLRKEKDILYSQIADIWKEVEQLDALRSCIEKWLQEDRELTILREGAVSHIKQCWNML